MTQFRLLAIVSFAFIAMACFVATAKAQVVYQTYYAPPTTAYYAPTTAYYAPTTAYYAPTTSYYAPTSAYYAPTTAYYAPTTAYYAPAPVVNTYYRPILGGVRYVRTPVAYYAPY